VKKKKRILVVRPDRIGDVVLSTPLPREIKKTYPDSFVAVFIRKYTRDIYINNPYVDEILLTDDYDNGSLKTFWKKVNEIRSYGFTHSLALLPTQRLNYLLFFSGIPYRVGVGHRLYQFLTFTHYVSRKKYIPLRHEADYCMDLARKIGVEPELLDPEIFLNEEEKIQVNKVRNELLDGRKYLIGIHSTSGNSSPNWTPTNYLKLIGKLNKNNNISLVVTDNVIPEELKNLDGVKYSNIGKSLRESFLTFSALDVLVSASTGPMHVAAALKVKTISMFCPMTACSPKLWGPLGNKSKIILPEENYCSILCPGDPKKCYFEGKDGINPEKVFDILVSELNIS